MNQKDIIDAWVWIRNNNHSIPDDVLDLMKDSAISKITGNDESVKLLIEIYKVNTNHVIERKITKFFEDNNLNIAL